jgi:hypothetical protein
MFSKLALRSNGVRRNAVGARRSFVLLKSNRAGRNLGGVLPIGRSRLLCQWRLASDGKLECHWQIEGASKTPRRRQRRIL